MIGVAEIEKQHRDSFVTFALKPLPKASWQTPDGRAWAPQDVLRGFNDRLSDAWAWWKLHQWVAREEILVAHVRLPSPLVRHSQADPTWRFIDLTFGPCSQRLGADLACPRIDVEFGACMPLGFVLSLMLDDARPRMVVPYESPYAFIFKPEIDLGG